MRATLNCFYWWSCECFFSKYFLQFFFVQEKCHVINDTYHNPLHLRHLSNGLRRHTVLLWKCIFHRCTGTDRHCSLKEKWEHAWKKKYCKRSMSVLSVRANGLKVNFDVWAVTFISLDFFFKQNASWWQKLRVVERIPVEHLEHTQNFYDKKSQIILFIRFIFKLSSFGCSIESITWPTKPLSSQCWKIAFEFQSILPVIKELVWENLAQICALCSIVQF